MTIQFKASATLPTRFGDFRIEVFADEKGREHIALLTGKPAAGALVRLHSECATGDIFGSFRCDCRDQLETALERIQKDGNGVLIYLRGHEGRGIGLANKIKAYALQERGQDTVEANLTLGFKADERSYDAAVGILQHYGLGHIRLLTNNRRKIDALEAAGIQVDKHLSLWTAVNPHNEKYLMVKKQKLDHMGENEVS